MTAETETAETDADADLLKVASCYACRAVVAERGWERAMGGNEDKVHGWNHGARVLPGHETRECSEGKGTEIILEREGMILSETESGCKQN